MFPPQYWSVYQRVLDGEPRTNNLIEGWHRRFQVIVNKSHPNIHEFMKRLKEEQQTSASRILQLVAGQPAKKPRKKVSTMNDKIVKIVTDYKNRTLQDYLKGLIFNIQYNTC